MDLYALKLELVRQILDLENPELIKELIIKLRKEDKDFWNELSDVQKDEIKLGLKQVEEGKVQSWESIKKKYNI